MHFSVTKYALLSFKCRFSFPNVFFIVKDYNSIVEFVNVTFDVNEADEAFRGDSNTQYFPAEIRGYDFEKLAFQF